MRFKSWDWDLKLLDRPKTRPAHEQDQAKDAHARPAQRSRFGCAAGRGCCSGTLCDRVADPSQIAVDLRCEIDEAQAGEILAEALALTPDDVRLERDARAI